MVISSLSLNHPMRHVLDASNVNIYSSSELSYKIWLNIQVVLLNDIVLQASEYERIVVGAQH